MLLVRDIRLPLSATKEDAVQQALRLAKIPVGAVGQAEIAKISVDARRKVPTLVYTVAIQLKERGAELAYAGSAPCVSLLQPKKLQLKNGDKKLNFRPVVVGLGQQVCFVGCFWQNRGFDQLYWSEAQIFSSAWKK